MTGNQFESFVLSLVDCRRRLEDISSCVHGIECGIVFFDIDALGEFDSAVERIRSFISHVAVRLFDSVIVSEEECR